MTFTLNEMLDATRRKQRLDFVRKQMRALARKGAKDSDSYRRFRAEANKLGKALGLHY